MLLLFQALSFSLSSNTSFLLLKIDKAVTLYSLLQIRWVIGKYFSYFSQNNHSGQYPKSGQYWLIETSGGLFKAPGKVLIFFLFPQKNIPVCHGYSLEAPHNICFQEEIRKSVDTSSYLELCL